MIKYVVFTEIHSILKKFYDLNQQQKCLICYLLKTPNINFFQNKICFNGIILSSINQKIITKGFATKCVFNIYRNRKKDFYLSIICMFIFL